MKQFRYTQEIDINKQKEQIIQGTYDNVKEELRIKTMCYKQLNAIEKKAIRELINKQKQKQRQLQEKEQKKKNFAIRLQRYKRFPEDGAEELP